MIYDISLEKKNKKEMKIILSCKVHFDFSNRGTKINLIEIFHFNYIDLSNQ